MIAITLPRLAGTRDYARKLVAESTESTENPETATLYARAVLGAAPAFVDELVQQLSELSISHIDVVGGSREFLSLLQRSADARKNVEVHSRVALGAR